MYGANLANLDFSGCRGKVRVDSDETLLEHPLIPADFWSLKKSTNNSYMEFIKWEGMVSSRTAYLVTYKCVDIERLNRGGRGSR